MQSLKVTAHLMTGFATKFDWSPSIDGILAWVVQRERLGVEEFTATHHRPDLQASVKGLPLRKWEREGDDWWYQCSMPIYQSHAVMTHNLHKRFKALRERCGWAASKPRFRPPRGLTKTLATSFASTSQIRCAGSVVGDKAEIVTAGYLISRTLGLRWAWAMGVCADGRLQ